MKHDEAKALLLDHAAEQLDEITNPRALERITTPSDGRGIGPDAIRTGTVAYSLVIEGWTNGTAEMPTPFVPGPPRPVPPPQKLTDAEMRTIERSIAGDDEAVGARRPGRGGFLSGLAASMDSGAPVRSSSDPGRFEKGAMRGASGRPADTNTERERYYFAERALRQRIDAMPVLWTRTGELVTSEMRLAVWVALRGPGRLVMRNMYQANVERHAKQLITRAKKIAAGKDPAKLAEPPKPPRAVLVPERRKDKTAEDASDHLRANGIDLARKDIATICQQIDDLLDEENEKRGGGWYRASAKPKSEAKGGEAMAIPGCDVDGWKEISEVVKLSPQTCRERATRTTDPLPVVNYAGRVGALKRELLSWCGRQTMSGPPRAA